MRRALFSVGLAGWMFVSAAPVHAQDTGCFCPSADAFTALPDQDLLYPLRGRALGVQEALRFFARNIRVGVVIDGDITGTIPDDFPEGLSRREYLDELSALFDLVWYFDGQVLRLSPVGGLNMEIMALSENSGASIIDVLQQLGIYQAKFTHRFDARSRTLMVAGPAHYTQVVKKAVEAIESADRSDIMLMRGLESGAPSALNALQALESDAPAASTPPAAN